jgi:NAD(P)-dependent dehydrogenase (short-subunit alcohol dehydrogenase family)
MTLTQTQDIAPIHGCMALNGISAKVLTERLESLERAGAVVRRTLPPPANVQVYDLTEWGYLAEPAIQELGRWAATSPHHDPTLPLSPVSLMLSFRTMLDTNVTATVRMATAFIPHLETQGGGLMIVSSMAGIFPVPFKTHYSATKAFLVHFGVGLWHELSGRNVSITTYAPSGVVSEMTAGDHFTPLRRWLMPVEQAASEGVEAFRTRKYVHISGFANRVGSAFARLLPHRFTTTLVAAQYRNALKKQSSAD